MGKYGTAREPTDDAVRRMRFVCSKTWLHICTANMQQFLRERTSVFRLYSHCMYCFCLMEAHFVLCKVQTESLYTECPIDAEKSR